MDKFIEALDEQQQFSSTSNSTIPSYVGFLFLLSSSFFYGSNYLPVKQFETGDGMFFQLILCLGIWTVGFVVNCVRNFPRFYALPMLGGLLWVIGNNNTVPIIRCIGMGLGMIFWNAIGLVVGWANARFGWFGIVPQSPSSQALNYTGVSLTVVGTIFYLFVKTETTQATTSKVLDLNENEQITNDTTKKSEEAEAAETSDKKDIFDRLGVNTKRILGIGLSICSGVCYGVTFTPVLYVIDNYNDSQNSLDYIFSFYTGILLSSLITFIIYTIFMKNKPVIYQKIILPGLVSGWMWGLANVSFFLAVNILSQAITFPISNSGPPIVASLWGVFLYKEIKGFKNLSFLLAGFTIALTGSVLVGLSK